MLVGLRNVDGDPSEALDPKPRPTMVMGNRSRLLLRANGKAELMVGRNPLRAAQRDEHRMVVGAIARLAVAGPENVAATRAGSLPIVDHRVDQIIVESPPDAKRVV